MNDYLNKDLSGMSNATLLRDLIITRVVMDELVASGVIEDNGYGRAIIRELIARGWTAGDILEQTNNAPWVDRALQEADEAVQRLNAVEGARSKGKPK